MPHAKPAEDIPILEAIKGFTFPQAVCGIVNVKENYNSISPKNVLFFGYYKQCAENIKDYPGAVIVDSLRARLKSYVVY